MPTKGGNNILFSHALSTNLFVLLMPTKGPLCGLCNSFTNQFHIPMYQMTKHFHHNFYATLTFATFSNFIVDDILLVFLQQTKAKDPYFMFCDINHML
jgi:hypothetical protein